jgi:putative FmdB family regulatory protein
MPMYRYTCSACGHEFRVIHTKGIPEDVICPSCQSTDTERRLPRVAVQFKGSGYYKTDRAGKSSKVGTKGATEKGGSPESATTPVKESSSSSAESSR